MSIPLVLPFCKSSQGCVSNVVFDVLSAYNNLTGSPPAELVMLSNLVHLELENNLLAGNITFLCDVNGTHPFQVLGADCQGSSGAVACSCCTCCNVCQ